MKLFLDCEFNEFGGELISMALVSEDGKHEFYEVLRYPEKPGAFVAEHVLPKLGKMAIGEKDFDEELARFQGWEPDCEIYADWPADFEHLCACLSRAGRAQGFSIPIECSMHLIRGDATIAPENPHNALSDARALRDWWQRTHGQIEEREAR